MLSIYIEKSFLDDFYLTYDEDKASQAQKLLYQILIEYPETKWFIDCKIESIKDLESLKQENPLIALKTDSFPPTPVDSLKESIRRQKGDKTVLVFTRNREEWFKEIEKQAVICFSFDTYENRINEIIQKYHYKIDLSEGDFKWRDLKTLDNFSYLLFNDNYILTDNNKKKLDHNLIPLLKHLIADFDREIEIEFYSKAYGEKPPGGPIQVKEAVTQKSQKLNRDFANYKVKFKIINNDLPVQGINFHDRLLMTNFQTIDCGVGFNLFPDKKSPAKKSNSQIVSETIFDLYTYKRLKNLKKAHKRYFNKISQDGFTNQFTYMK